MTTLLRGPITGPKAFAIFSSFFVVIIAVNVTLAVQAVRTFPGLEVRNSYVASQTFDRERQAQEALGWTAAARIEASLGRATVRSEDQSPLLVWNGADWRAPVLVGPGRWHLALVATAADGTAFRQRLDLTVE